METRSAALLALCLAACSSPSEQPARTAATASAAASAPASPPPPAGVADLVSGSTLGPLRIGMTDAEAGALGLPFQPEVTPGTTKIGPYFVSLEANRITSIRVPLADLPAGVRVGGAVFSAAGGATIKAIAEKLPACGPERQNTGANVILCDEGRTQLIAGGLAAVVVLQVNGPERAATLAAKDRASYGAPTQIFTHARLGLRFVYQPGLLRVTERPDGAVLESEVLGKVEDRSGAGKDLPQPLRITVSVRPGELAQALGAAHFEKKDCESGTMAGHVGCRLSRGSHEAQQELVFAPLGNGKTLAVECSFLGDAARPKILFADQRKACEQVVSSVSIDR